MQRTLWPMQISSSISNSRLLQVFQTYNHHVTLERQVNYYYNLQQYYYNSRFTM